MEIPPQLDHSKYLNKFILDIMARASEKYSEDDLCKFAKILSAKREELTNLLKKYSHIKDITHRESYPKLFLLFLLYTSVLHDRDMKLQDLTLSVVKRTANLFGLNTMGYRNDYLTRTIKKYCRNFNSILDCIINYAANSVYAWRFTNISYDDGNPRF